MSVQRAAALAMVVLLMSGGAITPAWSQAPSPGGNATTAASRGTRIGPKDQLRIVVEELPTLAEEWTVGDDGYLTLEPVGRILVQGSTEVELSQRIKERLLQQGLRRATVTVVVTAIRSRPILVLGAVANPGNQSVGGSIRLMEVLLAAGGLAADHGPTLQIRRTAENGLSDQVVIAVRDLLEDLDPDVNLPLFAGDVIHVAAARPIQIHLLGAVKTVGTVTFKNTERVSLLTAIARAGGLTETASRKISLKRTDPNTGKLEEKVVDFRRILDGKEADLELQDGDILVVKESYF